MARRSLFSSYFSRESVRRAEPLIQTHTSKFFGVLQAAASNAEGQIVNLSKGFQCLTSDVIMDFTFNKPLGALDAPDFNFRMIRALSEAAIYAQWAAYFPGTFENLVQFIDKLPLWFVEKYIEPLAVTKWCVRVSS